MNVNDEPLGKWQFLAYSALRAVQHPKILLQVNPLQVLQAEGQYRKREVELNHFVSLTTGSTVDKADEALSQFNLPASLQRYPARMCLYGIVKLLHPNNVVETGCGGGFGSAYILHALDQNGKGELASVDSAEYYNPKYFNLPEGLPCGGFVPNDLRLHWHLFTDGAKARLPALFEGLGTIDLFIHDSLHTHEHMTFEFEQAWEHLKTGGVLMSHDIWLPWVKFAERVNRNYVVYQHYGALVK